MGYIIKSYSLSQKPKNKKKYKTLKNKMLSWQKNGSYYQWVSDIISSALAGFALNGFSWPCLAKVHNYQTKFKKQTVSF